MLKAQASLELQGYRLGGPLRRSEIGAPDVDDVTFASESAFVNLRRPKTDQIGSGTLITCASAPKVCTVRALSAWLEAAEIADGLLFRAIDRHGRVGGRLSRGAVASIVQARAPGTNIGGHLLRSGFSMSAVRGGHTEAAIMRHGHWKSVVLVRDHIREGALWDELVGVP